MPFVKIDCGIVNSTIWLDRPAREIFFTALLLAEPHELTENTAQLAINSLEQTGWIVPAGWYGFVPASGVGIIDRSKVPIEEGRLALTRLGEPELESRSQEFDGRRLVRIDGGFIVLNYMKYRERDYTTASRSRRYRERKKRHAVSSRSHTVASRDITHAEAEAYADKQKDLALNVDPDPVKIETQACDRSARTRVNGEHWNEDQRNNHGKPTNLINGVSQRRHGTHAWCSADRPNLCVPFDMHQEILGASAKSDADVKAWYAATVEKYAGQPIGDDRFTFWRNELANWLGTVTAPPLKKRSGAASGPSLKELRERYEERQRNAKPS